MSGREEALGNPSLTIPFFQKGFLAALFLYAAALPISMAATNFALALAVFFSCFLFDLKGWREFFPKSIFFILIFFLWAAITQGWSGGGFKFAYLNSFSKIWNFLPCLLVPFGFKIIKNRVSPTLRTLMISGALVVLLGAVQYWTGTRYFFEGWFGSDALVIQDRFYGFQSHPLHSGGLYAILFLVSFSIALSYRSYPEGAVIDRRDMVSNYGEIAFWSLCSLFLGLGVLLTGSRSYYLAMAVGILILLAWRGIKFFAGGLIVGMCVSVLLLFLIRPYDLFFENRIKSISVKRMDDSGKQRLYLWKSALSMIRDHPIRGVGYKNWKENLPHYVPDLSIWKTPDAALAHAHNSYLTVTSETGMVGLVFFLLFWFFLVREELAVLRSFKKKTFAYSLSLGTIAAIFSLMTAAFFEHNLLTATICLALFFVIGLSRAEGGLKSYTKPINSK